MVSLILTKGKGEFIRRKLSNGEIQEICKCKWNADFSKACIAQVHGAYLEEVIRNNGRYDKGSMPAKRKKHGIDKRCDYCYAYTNWGQVTPRIVDKTTEQEFSDKKPEIVRIGKNVECGHPFYIPTLINFLKLCEKYQTQIIFPTKMLPFEKEVSNYLIKASGALHYSIGADRFEEGAVTQGFTNQWRIEQAKKYHDAGMNTDLTIVCDLTSSLEDNAKVGFSVMDALEASRRYGIPARFIPIRIGSNKLAKEITGHTMKELRNTQPSLPGYELEKSGLWMKRGNNDIYPTRLHPDFQGLYDSGIGICGAIGEEENCDDCNLCSGVRIKFNLDEIPLMDYTLKVNAKRRYSWMNKEKIKAEKERHRHQKEFEFKPKLII